MLSKIHLSLDNVEVLNPLAKDILEVVSVWVRPLHNHIHLGVLVSLNIQFSWVQLSKVEVQDCLRAIRESIRSKVQFNWHGFLIKKVA